MKKAVVALSLVGIWLSLAPVQAQTGMTIGDGNNTHAA